MDTCTGVKVFDPELASQLLGNAWATKDGIFERASQVGLRYEWVHVYWNVVNTVIQRARRYTCLGTYAERFNSGTYSMYVEKLAFVRSFEIANQYLEHEGILSYAHVTFPQNACCYTLRLEAYGLKALTEGCDTWSRFIYAKAIQEDWLNNYDARDPRPVAVGSSFDRTTQTHTYLGSIRTSY